MYYIADDQSIAIKCRAPETLDGGDVRIWVSLQTRCCFNFGISLEKRSMCCFRKHPEKSVMPYYVVSKTTPEGIIARWRNGEIQCIH